MNREIKFRGKRKDNGEWVYGYYFDSARGASIIITTGVIDVDTGVDDVYVEVIPETVGEYTGLKDNNGKEIYDGDIISAKDEERHEDIWKIVFENGCFIAYRGNNNYFLRMDYWISKEMEIIGNVHQNHELLEEQK